MKVSFFVGFMHVHQLANKCVFICVCTEYVGKGLNHGSCGENRESVWRKRRCSSLSNLVPIPLPLPLSAIKHVGQCFSFDFNNIIMMSASTSHSYSRWLHNRNEMTVFAFTFRCEKQERGHVRGLIYETDRTLFWL